MAADTLRTGKPYWYNTTNTKVNSTFHPSGVEDKSSISLSGWD